MENVARLDTPNPSLLKIQNTTENTIHVEEANLQSLRTHDLIKESGTKGNAINRFSFLTLELVWLMVEEKMGKGARNLFFL